MVDEAVTVGSKDATIIQLMKVRSKWDIEESLDPKEGVKTGRCHADHRLVLQWASISRWDGVETRLTTAEGSFKRAWVVIKYNALAKGYLRRLIPEVIATVVAGVESASDGTINNP